MELIIVGLFITNIVFTMMLVFQTFKPQTKEFNKQKEEQPIFKKAIEIVDLSKRDSNEIIAKLKNGKYDFTNKENEIDIIQIDNRKFKVKITTTIKQSVLSEIKKGEK